MRNRVYTTIVAELNRERGVRDACYDAGRGVIFRAITHAPFRTGAYKAGLALRRVRLGTTAARVIANDRKSVWLEYGTGEPAPSPHFEVLTRAVHRSGFHRVDYVPHVRKGKRGAG